MRSCVSPLGLNATPGQFFLATKTGERTYDGAKRQIHLSLERLEVERVDLIQLHSLADPIEWDTALSPNGALEACIEAREQGLVRFIGVTGHGLKSRRPISGALSVLILIVSCFRTVTS